METRIAATMTRCYACNWGIYQEQEAPCRVTQEVKDGRTVEHVEFYCGEHCFNHPEPDHHSLGPVS